MEDLDKKCAIDDPECNEEDMFLKHVIRDEHDLLYLDTYLKETFG